MTEQSAPSFKLWWLSINTIRIVILCSSSPSRVCASLFITIRAIPHYDPIGLVYSIHDSTEVASQRMIDVQSQVTGEPKDGWGINAVIKRHLELEINTLQNAPRDADKLRRLLEVKQRQKQEADHIEDSPIPPFSLVLPYLLLSALHLNLLSSHLYYHSDSLTIA